MLRRQTGTPPYELPNAWARGYPRRRPPGFLRRMLLALIDALRF